MAYPTEVVRRENEIIRVLVCAMWIMAYLALLCVCRAMKIDLASVYFVIKLGVAFEAGLQGILFGPV